MRRSTRRAGTIVAVVCAAAFTTALPAFAKGEVIPVHVTASVTGPGLGTPVVIRWGGDCPFPEYCGSNGGAKGLDGFSFLNSAGVLGRATTGPGPAQSLLGPKYEITYRVVSSGVVMTAHQDLYPFGPGTSQYDPQRPWLYAQPGQDGSFTIENVPPGRHRVHVWHERIPTEVIKEVTAGADGDLQIALNARGYKWQPHRNKYGRNYPTNAGHERY